LDGPVFAEPWQAQAFALTVRLSTEGAFAWFDWVAALSRERAADRDEDGSRYYTHWVTALESLLTERGLLDARTPGQKPAGTRSTASRLNCWPSDLPPSGHAY